MLTRPSVALPILLLGLPGCGPGAGGRAPGSTLPPAEARRDLPCRPLLQSQTSGWTQPATFVVDDPVAWERFWSRHKGRAVPAPARPAVAFASEVVLVAALGERPSQGNSVAFGAIVGDGRGGVDAEVRVGAPDPGSVTASSRTSPVAAVAIPRPEGAVRFTRVPD